MAELTPMFKQFYEIKEKYPNDILFFRMGDFYEMFGEDARVASKILNITLTSRAKGTENETPMCGIPHHAAEGYMAKLTRAGKRVAVCDQISDPALPGIVKRDVVRVVTPGTTMDENVLDNNNNNYLLSLYLQKDVWGLAICDLTTGEFQASEFGDVDIIKTEVNRLDPNEVIVAPELYNDSRYSEYVQSLNNVQVYTLPAYEKAEKSLSQQFKVKNLSSFGLNEIPNAIEAAGQLLGYLKETQKTSLEHLLTIKRYAAENFMVLDQSTIRNLELFQNNWDFSRRGSLIGVLDRTLTAMGARLLRKNIALPYISVNQINARHEAVEELIGAPIICDDFITNLKQMVDFERLVGKIGCARANARDLVALKNSLVLIAPIVMAMENVKADLLIKIKNNLPENTELIELIEKTLVDEPPAMLTDGGMIREGNHQELDDLRQVSRGGKEWLMDYQTKQIEVTGISTLKVKFNKVFGYYIEMSKANALSAPANYIRKQTLVNAERFITPELKEYEDKVLGAEDKIGQIEYQLFNELREKVVKYFADIQLTALLIAELDVLLGFSIIAKENNYCRPHMNDNDEILIKEGRHPVIETIEDRYVPNDATLDHKTNEMIILTGPNMSGKSSFLRQVALITLMAQIGCFVPAKEANLAVVDRIFTRVGASDNLSQGVSTFMNEMQEAANILHNATKRSLIILDEVGRGTSTFDGVSIAWAIVEYIHNELRAKTLFATHYHELTEIVTKLDRVENYCVAVSEKEGKVVFLHQIVKGATSDSYGIEVAKLAGLPSSIIERAEEVLRELEEKSNMVIDKPIQTSLQLSPKEERLTKAIAKVDPNTITPLEALQKIEEWRKELE
ncbi:DNA mismatch repair protein MutS [Candidatus Falkowbacteria bacterium CG10_big_fil_rev_8_21_14_0_10_39_11]|uniref:DNA mismatch repair protein MutS n=1 Tax=Candidatus Falkowbacteria bacterium CG10_big_fil_rev_8_21_14_0_10_39_11 TaxID=1974565 RepID=A0A2H0V5K1_9BACT|nr:MAG: DNA mismatch repair protein MutS [Candidatus Falkowbacteria bacterium CG10_big_fil_rev_8_21_14_0_10_39_11]